MSFSSSRNQESVSFIGSQFLRRSPVRNFHLFTKALTSLDHPYPVSLSSLIREPFLMTIPHFLCVCVCVNLRTVTSINRHVFSLSEQTQHIKHYVLAGCLGHQLQIVLAKTLRIALRLR
jgi:hypothetical protein